MKLKIVLVLVVIAALLISVFLHEMGHCLAFRHNGFEVERVAVGPVGPAKLTVFTDSYGTKYDIGPLPIIGATYPKDPAGLTKLSLGGQAETLLAGVAFNGLVIIFLTPWYFWLRKRWRKRGEDFSSIFLGKILRVFIVVNFILLICNFLILLPLIDGGRLLCLVLSQWVGLSLALGIGFGAGFVSLFLLLFRGFDFFFKKINKAYGWSK